MGISKKKKEEFNKFGVITWMIFSFILLVIDLSYGLSWILGTYFFEELGRNKF